MITRSILEWLSSVGGWFLRLLPRLPGAVDSWIDEAVTAFNNMAGWVVKLDPVIPFDVIDHCFLIMLGALAIAFTIEIGRVVVGYIPTMTGNT